MLKEKNVEKRYFLQIGRFRGSFGEVFKKFSVGFGKFSAGFWEEKNLKKQKFEGTKPSKALFFIILIINYY